MKDKSSNYMKIIGFTGLTVVGLLAALKALELI